MKKLGKISEIIDETCVDYGIDDYSMTHEVDVCLGLVRLDSEIFMPLSHCDGIEFVTELISQLKEKLEGEEYKCNIETKQLCKDHCTINLTTDIF